MEAREVKGPQWVLHTFLGWILGFALMLLLIGVSGMVGLGDTQFPIGLGMGAGVGIMQARLIGRLGADGRRWSLASALGMAAPFLVGDVAKLTPYTVPFSLALYIVFGGILTGILQWPVLRPVGRRAPEWIGVAAVGWTLASVVIPFNETYLPRIPGITGALLYVGVVLVGGVILGVVGGMGLARIVRR